MTLHIPFDNTYARLPGQFYTKQAPTPVSQPSVVAFNTALADTLGISGTDDPRLAALFAGTDVPDGAEPLAQLYAGHQFGSFNPQLGDGRALLLGEVVGQDGVRRDIQLKGSGPTPYSRMGDGRAWLGPVLREYIMSEAMAALGIPTTRALAAVRTGDVVLRETPLPGAVLTRVAASHIRVGTFQIFAARGDWPALRALYDYTVDRHYPDVADPHALFDAVMARQATLIAQWMAIGFIHGVMNTDNCTLSGETIDYGPCAFMDAYAPDRVFSSIDRFGRYNYSAQADIIVWNMAQLASSLVPLLPDQDAAVERFTQQVHSMPGMIRAEWLTRFSAKLGIADPTAEDAVLIADLLDLMHKGGSDFTNTFRALRVGKARDEIADRDGFDAWARRWDTRRAPDGADLMAQANPVIIPRTHQIEAAITAAVAGDDAPFHRLTAALATPVDDRDAIQDLTMPPTDTERVTATFCGT